MGAWGGLGGPWGLALGLAPLAACSDRLVLTAPPGVEHWALVALDAEDDRVRGASALQPASERLELELPLGERAFLMTYGAGLLERLGIDELGSAPLQSAEACASRLPPADVLYALRGDELELSSAEELPAMTAQGLGARCDDGGLGEVLVDVQCVSDPCPATATRDGCRLEIEGPACGIERFTALADPAQEACIAAGPCTVEPASADALVSLSCRRPNFDGPCAVKLFRAEPFPEVSIERVQVLDVPPAYPMAGSFRYAPYVIRTGYLGDVVITDAHVLVTSLVGSLGGVGACIISGTRQRVHVYGRRDLSLQTERTLPRCAWGLLETGPGSFMGFTLDAPSSSVLALRFDLEGGAVRTSTLSQVEFEGAFVTSALRLEENLNVVAVSSPMVSRGRLLFVDDAGALRFEVELPGTEPSGLAALREGFVLTESHNDAFMLFDSSGGRLATIQIPDRASRSLAAPHLHRPSNHLAVPIPRDLRQVALLRNDLDLQTKRALHYERQGAPTAITDWPPDPRLLLVGLSLDAAEPTVHVARLDPVAGHYLPGTLEVGPGSAAVMRTDPEGRVYILLSWAAQLVRLTPP